MFEKALAFFEEHLKRDSYCNGSRGYELYNIYLDSPDNHLIKSSVAKPVFKEKLRLRAYELPNGPDDEVFFEIKRKYKGVVSKRRSVMRYKDALYMMDHHSLPDDIVFDKYIDGRVAKEIEYMLQMYDLSPKLYLAYNRIAFKGKGENKDIRVTFDRRIRSRRENPTFDAGDGGNYLTGDEEILMEIKFPYAMPLWIVRFLSENKLYNTSFSKYGTEYRMLVENKVKMLSELTDPTDEIQND